MTYISETMQTQFAKKINFTGKQLFIALSVFASRAFHVIFDSLYTSLNVGSFPVIRIDTLKILAASLRKK